MPWLSSVPLHPFLWASLVVSACSSPPPKQTVTSRPEPTAPKVEPADLVLVDGHLHTQDPDLQEAEALAVRGSRIVMVGDRAQVDPFIGRDTKVVQLEGRSVSPGLSDAHCHLYNLGAARESVDLRGSKSPAAAAKKVARAAAGQSQDTWIVGRGWDQNLWDGQRFPSAADLDAVIASHPVAVSRIDGHALWVNAAGMRLAGIDDATADPAGGKIVRDQKGRATGIFIDTAMALVRDKIPPAADAVIERRILAAAELALAAGITTVHEMGIPDRVVDVYRELARQDRLPLRVYAFLSGDVPTAMKLAEREPDNDGNGEAMFIMRGIKLYADGALGSRGAALLAPYADDPGNQGLWVTSAEDLSQAAVAVAKAGWQLAVHAIGDAGNRATLDAFAAAIAAHPHADLRFRVEHAQILAPEDIPRFSEMDVIASMQPTHATSDMPWAEARLGPERIKGAYAWRSLLDSGARIAGGSDFPVEGVSPLLGIYAAVTRQDHEGKPKGGFTPDQQMELGEALDSFTREPAYASFVESQRGMLREGQVADITVFDRKLAADRSLLSTRIDMTIVGGRIQFQRER